MSDNVLTNLSHAFMTYFSPSCWHAYRRLSRLCREGLRADDRDDMTMRPRDALLTRWQWGRSFGICEWLDLRFCQGEFARFGSSSVLPQDCSDELRARGVITDWRWILVNWRLIHSLLFLVILGCLWFSHAVFFARFSSLRYRWGCKCTYDATKL